SGYLADKTQRYWLITILGYSINVLSVPLLALTNYWPTAAFLIILERFGKSVRIPARDAMLARASQTVGMGYGFGLHQALDQTGGMLGPFLVALILFFTHNYKDGFAILIIPALLTLLTLYIAYKRYPHPHRLEMTQGKVKPPISSALFKL